MTEENQLARPYVRDGKAQLLEKSFRHVGVLKSAVTGFVSMERLSETARVNNYSDISGAQRHS